MMNRKSAVLGLITCFTFLSAFQQTAIAEIRLEGRLHAQSDSEPFASGKAKFESRGDRTRLSIEVEDILVATEVTMRIGKDSWSLPIIFGGADLNLDNRDGDNVPNLAADQTVTVFADGVKILQGTLQSR